MRLNWWWYKTQGRNFVLLLNNQSVCSTITIYLNMNYWNMLTSLSYIHIHIYGKIHYITVVQMILQWSFFFTFKVLLKRNSWAFQIHLVSCVTFHSGWLCQSGLYSLDCSSIDCTSSLKPEYKKQNKLKCFQNKTTYGIFLKSR